MTIASYVLYSNTQRVLIFRRPGAKIDGVFYEIYFWYGRALCSYGVCILCVFIVRAIYLNNLETWVGFQDKNEN